MILLPEASRHQMGGGCYEREPRKGVGIAVMRAQPFHLGHEYLLNIMRNETDRFIVVIGSGQESRTISNPWTWQERVAMIQHFWNNGTFAIYVVPDIGAATDSQWCNFVLKHIFHHPNPTQGTDDYTKYFCGSAEDGAPWTKCVPKVHVRDLKRNTTGDTSGKSHQPPNFWVFDFRLIRLFQVSVLPRSVNH